MGIGFEIDFSKCTECERCMIACSLEKTEIVKLDISRIKIKRQWPELPFINVCRFSDCKDKPCIGICPVSAIYDKEGFILIDEETCTGCEKCIDVCPFNAIFMNSEGKAFKCDFCNGDPACVKECVTKAILIKGEN